jgi:hypothetical protein
MERRGVDLMAGNACFFGLNWLSEAGGRLLDGDRVNPAENVDLHLTGHPSMGENHQSETVSVVHGSLHNIARQGGVRDA